jgi:VWFA-related protein
MALLLLLAPPGAPAQRPMPGQVDPAKVKPQVPEPSVPAPATPSPDSTTSDDVRFGVSVNIIVAPTTVVDRTGAFVPGLTAGDFVLLDNEKRQDVKVDEAFYPISLVVVVQANSVMDSMLKKIRPLGPMLDQLLTGEHGEVAVLAFDHRVQLVQDFTSDPDKMKNAFAAIRPGGRYNATIDAVNEATRMLAHRPKDHRRLILLIGETRAQGNQTRIREALLNAQIQNVVVYTVNVNRMVTRLTSPTEAPRPNPMPPAAHPVPGSAPQTPNTVEQTTGLYGSGIQFMPVFEEIFKDVKAIFVDNPAEAFTKYTGGREFGFITAMDLQRAVERMSAEVHGQYLLSYNPNNKLEGGWHEIHVTVRRPDLVVRTRRGYWLAARPD